MAKQPLFHNFRMVEEERSGGMFIKHSQTGSSQNQRGRLVHCHIDGLLQFLLRLVDLGGDKLHPRESFLLVCASIVLQSWQAVRQEPVPQGLEALIFLQGFWQVERARIWSPCPVPALI